MTTIPYRSALIVGAGVGISASVARALAGQGVTVALAARDVAKLSRLAAETGAATFTVDASDAGQVESLFRKVDAAIGEPEIVLYNASKALRGPLLDQRPDEVAQAVATTALGAFYVVQQAARRMLPKRNGAILLTGATAGVKGFARSAPFAMGKFALHGLAQSAARELSPQGIHVAHFVIDGGVRSEARPADDDDRLDPNAIAQSYLDVLRQPRSAWSMEIELRPWVESF